MLRWTREDKGFLEEQTLRWFGNAQRQRRYHKKSSADDIKKEEESRQNKAERGYSV